MDLYWIRGAKKDLSILTVLSDNSKEMDYIIDNHIGYKLFPLVLMQDGRLVCYKRGMILVLKDGDVKSKFPFPISCKERLLGWNRYISRLLRLGIRGTIALDDNHLVLSQSNMLYELDLVNGGLSKGWYCGKGIRPLSFTNVEGIKSFDDGLYYGGYLENNDKKPVSIYHRVGKDQWKEVYTFPQNSINHVHNIILDPFRSCLWIFTGDFGEAAAIWKVTDNFKKVERVAYNDQKYRACVAYALPEGLLYATDAPFADNYIYLMNSEDYSVKKIAPIDGSCIYGCQWKDKYVFSTTVEGDGRNTSRMEFYFGRKRGSGIKDEYVHMYCGNLQEGFKELYKEKKDWLPYCTFQFGVFKFPYGVNNTDALYFQPVATSENDLKLMGLKKVRIQKMDS